MQKLTGDDNSKEKITLLHKLVSAAIQNLECYSSVRHNVQYI